MIFGVGSGRCGTKSLSKVLVLTHEEIPLPWEFHGQRFEDAMLKVGRSRGDVSLTWIRYARAIWDRYPDARFVCLKRDKDATVKSWVKQMSGRKKFGIYSLFENLRTGKYEVHNIFPDYGDMPIEEAAPRFYEDYYAEAGRLQEEHPKRFRIFESPHVLADRKYQREMLRFCGSRARVNTRVHETSRGDRKQHEFQNRINDVVAAAISDTMELSKEDFGRLFSMGKRYFGDITPEDLRLRIQRTDALDPFYNQIAARSAPL